MAEPGTPWGAGDPPSLLFPAGEVELASSAPVAVHDVNLDQLFTEVAVGARQHNLMPFLWTPLSDPTQIRFRQEVMADLDAQPVRSAIIRFQRAIGEVDAALAPQADPDAPTGPPIPGAPRVARLDRTPEADRALLNAVLRYGSALIALADDLARLDLHSGGMLALRTWLAEHVGSGDFPQMMAAARAATQALRAIRYTLTLSANTIAVRPDAAGADSSGPDSPAEQASYQRELEVVLARFAPDPAVPVDQPKGRLDPVGILIRERLAELHPQAFADLAAFAAQYRNHFIAPAVRRFDSEASFYLAFLAVADRVRAMGLPMCYPVVDGGTSLVVSAGYDLALATRFFGRDVPVVTNDVEVCQPQRLVVVTGPNQGGKTTFARMYAQLHWLAGLGVLVPAAAARVGTFDHLLTHFDRPEQVADLRGKLADDLHRIADLLAAATPRSVVVLNEVFASTTLVDAIELSRLVLGQLADRGCRVVCVTFIDELASFDAETVSLVAGLVDPPSGPAGDAAAEQRRSFVLTRRPADGRAHARAIAARHRVTLADIMDRVGQ